MVMFLVKHTSYGVYITQLIRFARASSCVTSVCMSFLSVCLTNWLSLYLPVGLSICFSTVCVYLSVCLACLSVCPSAHPLSCLSVCLSVCLCLSVSLSVCPPASRSVHLSICVLSVCLSAYLLPCLFVDPPICLPA